MTEQSMLLALLLVRLDTNPSMPKYLHPHILVNAVSAWKVNGFNKNVIVEQ